MSVVKLACVHAGQVPALFEFDQKEPLAQIINKLCEGWRIPNPDQWSFKDDATKFYITEKNRVDLKDGAVLLLALTPSAQAEKLVKDANSRDVHAQKRALEELQRETKDVTFANKFVEKNGIQVLNRVLGGGDPQSLGYALAAYSELLHHGLIDMMALNDDFIQKIIALTSKDVPLIVRSALRIMSAYVERSPKGFQLVQQSRDLSYQRLIMHCTSSDLSVQEGALGLVNSMIVAAPAASKQKMCAELQQNNIFGALKSRMGQETIPVDMARELFKFQRLWLNQQQTKAQTPYTQSDFCNKRLEELKQCLPELDDEFTAKSKRQSGVADVWKKLGFEDPQRPETQFMQPPGILALECMAFFAVAQQDLYNKVVLDQLSRPEEYSCPFARMSCAVVTLLMDVLEMKTPPAPGRSDFNRIFFSKPQAFNEMFCVAIQLASKTWREMEAKLCDFDKVMTVVSKQIRKVLSDKKMEPKSMEEFKDMLFSLTYEVMLAFEMETIRDRQDALLRSAPVRDFKKKVKQDLIGIIRKERLAHLCEGAFFHQLSDKGKLKKDVNMFVVLSPNHKILHWGELPSTEETRPSPVALANQAEVTKVRNLLVGKDVPAVVKYKRPDEIADRAFSYGVELVENTIDLVAMDRQTASKWIDGIRILTGKNIETENEEETKRDLDHLLGLEMSLRMLDMYGVMASELNPTVPPLPTNFDFYYETPGDESAA